MRLVHENQSFCGLKISKMKRLDCRSGLFWSWSGPVVVFFQSWDRTFKHYIKAKTNNLKTPTNSEHKWFTATKEHPLLSHMLKSFPNILRTPKIPLLSLPTTKNTPVFIGPFAKKITNMDFPEMTTTTAHFWTHTNHCLWWQILPSFHWTLIYSRLLFCFHHVKVLSSL